MSHNEWIFTIEGMTCEHCSRSIDKAVGHIPGVVGSRTYHEAGTSRVTAESDLDVTSLIDIIQATGYRVVGHRQIGHKTHDSDGSGSHGSDGFDLLIIGAGSAGFAAAIRATELGAQVALVERGALGGTCVNVGCVPSKTLIRAAEVHHRAGHHAFAGINTKAHPPEFEAVIGQKRQLVAELQQTKYRDVLASYPSIKLINGNARFRTDATVEVNDQRVRARKILLAVGSSAWLPSIPGLTQSEVLTSTELMELDSLPERLVVLGGGYVGLELAQTFARLGSRVSVLARSRLVSREDEDVSFALATHLSREGIDVHTGVKILNVSGKRGSLRISFMQDDESLTIETDEVLVATGRRPNSTGLGLESAGIACGDRGEVLVDEHLRTRMPNIYAAGDAIGEPAFVYVAAYAGALAAENAIKGDSRTYDVSVLPRVTFTDPAVASVGLTETEARKGKLDVMVTNLPMSYVPRSIAARDTRGFIKLVADKVTGLLVGAHILAPEAGDIIQQAAMAIRFGIGIDDIVSMFHPYLTNAEAFKLACQTFSKDIAKLSCCST